jgi:hypothetical protein
MCGEAQRVVAFYDRFAKVDAVGRSPLYGAWAEVVAGDREIVGRLMELPAVKRQPNLLFTAVRVLYGLVEAEDFGVVVRERWEEVAAVMLARSTQTNEPGRCAALLPVLASLPQPLALLEVGASAGLCLLPDHYMYDYGAHGRVGGGGPAFTCAVSGDGPEPRTIDVAWRRGLDLSPVDLQDADERAWLEALIWPGMEDERLAGLRGAIAVARRERPEVLQGDLRTDLPAVAADAPRDATLVVFHTAVLAYVLDAGERAAFGATVRSLDACWLANEAPAIHPGAHVPADEIAQHPQDFLLALDGEPVAWTEPYGRAIRWR